VSPSKRKKQRVKQFSYVETEIEEQKMEIKDNGELIKDKYILEKLHRAGSFG